MNPVLAQWNALPEKEAAQQILPCCGSNAWAERLATTRPYPSLEGLVQGSDEIWQSLPKSAWLEAFATHPRIGELQATASPQSLAWSTTEQSAVDQTARATLAEANQLYEQKFNRTFIICATGKSAQQMLAILNQRLASTPDQELAEAAEQQRQITNLRLAKWLEGR